MRVAWLVVLPALCGCSTVLRPLTTTDAATGLEQITRSHDNELDPAVAPDGKSIAYEVTRAPGATPHVEVMDLARGRVIFSSGDTPGVDPAWMPTSDSIVFVGKSGGLVQTYGQGVRPVFLADIGDPSFRGGARPAVSPDGRLIALAVGSLQVLEPGWPTSREVDHALAVTDTLGTGLEVIQHGTDPTYSRDGKKMAFVRRSQGHMHVFVANADGTSAQEITDGSEDDRSPTFSPDGRWVAFCAVRGEAPSEEANLFAVHTDGTGLVQLTEGDRLACKPSWAADGAIYFHANADDRFHVFRLRPLLGER